MSNRIEDLVEALKKAVRDQSISAGQIQGTGDVLIRLRKLEDELERCTLPTAEPSRYEAAVWLAQRCAVKHFRILASDDARDVAYLQAERRLQEKFVTLNHMMQVLHGRREST